MGVILIVITMMPLISKSFDLIVILKKNLSTLRCHKTQKQYLAVSSMN